MVATAYGLTTDDPCSESDGDSDVPTYSPTVKMWSKLEGNIATFDLSVDGNDVGSFDNSSGKVSATLDDAKKGKHSFTMSNVVVYQVVPSAFGPRLVPVASGLQCTGSFRVASSRTLKIAALLVPTGELQCKID